jgi:superfamily II DNA or RNA helicase
MKVDYKQHVPEGYTLRGKQEYILDRLSQVRNSGMKFALCCLPVGLGKSVLAVSICNAEGSSYVPMPNNQLMAQYAKSFEDVRLLRGRKWLPCTYEDPETNQFAIPLIRQGKVFKVEESASCAVASIT